MPCEIFYSMQEYIGFTLLTLSPQLNLEPQKCFFRKDENNNDVCALLTYRHYTLIMAQQIMNNRWTML